jgi:hypothetical protein
MNNLIHGDVNLIHTNLPATAKLVDLEKTNSHKRGVWIELGEHSANAHVIAPTKGGIVQFYLDGEDLYLEVKEAPAVITHEEHAPLIINPGVYRKMIEWEYDPFLKRIKKVVD